MLAGGGHGEAIKPLDLSPAIDIVELVILTKDDAFLRTLREAVGETRRLWHVSSSDKVSDLLVAGQVGIVVIDAQSLNEPANSFVSHIKRQFPDLVVIAAGPRDAELALAPLISMGAVYRFIHKPMSPARGKLFVETAVKRYIEQRRSPVQPIAARSWINDRSMRIGIAAAALLALVLGTLAVKHASYNRSAGQEQAAEDRRSGIRAGEESAPLSTAETHERLLARAETALMEERLDEAAAAIEDARKAGVDGARLAFLASQLAASRELRKAGTEARAKSDPRQADAKPADRLAQELALAAERLQQGRLIEPINDSARFHLAAALRADPTNDATLAAQQSLAIAMMSQAHGAIDRRDFPRAVSLLEAADGIVSPANLESLSRQLRESRRLAEADARQGTSASQAVTSPIGVAQTAGAPIARSAAGAVPSAAGSGGGVTTAISTPNAAGLPGAGVGQVAGPAGSGPAQAPPALSGGAAAAAPINASQLSLIKSVQPTYPAVALRAQTEGWVELAFTVNENGTVKDIAVQAANPSRVFDGAAISALSRFRFKPVLEGGRPIAQRAVIRIRFALGN